MVDDGRYGVKRNGGPIIGASYQWGVAPVIGLGGFKMMVL